MVSRNHRVEHRKVTPPLFITGIARGGTTLLARMLDSHPAVAVAADPMFPLYRSFRNAVLSEIDPDTALSDYYFSDERTAQMDRLLAADLGKSFDVLEKPSLERQLKDRQSHECPDLIPHIGQIWGETYFDLFANISSVIAQARSKPGLAWAGVKDVWILDFFPAVARAFSDARFVVIHRDPRAAIASMLELGAKDPDEYGHPLSYARHWRKYIALTLEFERSPIFRERLLSIRYEDLVNTPSEIADRICKFLGIPFTSAIIDTSKYRDYTTGKSWDPNTSGADFRGISASRVDSWRSSLLPEVRSMIESVCGPEMNLFGYEDVQCALPDAAEFAAADPPRVSWRSDFRAPVRDAELELRRRALLMGATPSDENEIRRHFLFPNVFHALTRLAIDAEIEER